MPRGQLPRAYLRLDPDIDQTHPDNLDGFIRLLCAANRQRPRGRFRSRHVLDSLFGKHGTHRFLDRGDAVIEEDGTVSVPGWDLWQEGDMTVGERVTRLRQKRSIAVTTALPNGVETVPPRLGVGRKALGVVENDIGSTEALGRVEP